MTKDIRPFCCLNYISHYFDITHSIFLVAASCQFTEKELFHKRLSMSTSLVTFLLLLVTCAAIVGISHSMVLSVALLTESMARSIWQQQLSGKKNLHRHRHRHIDRLQNSRFFSQNQ